MQLDAMACEVNDMQKGLCTMQCPRQFTDGLRHGNLMLLLQVFDTRYAEVAAGIVSEDRCAAQITWVACPSAALVSAMVPNTVEAERKTLDK